VAVHRGRTSSMDITGCLVEAYKCRSQFQRKHTSHHASDSISNDFISIGPEITEYIVPKQLGREQ
jgi:hypothetical protein